MSFCIYRDFQSVFITVITNTELPKTLRSVQCHRKRILPANCESLCHLDKLGMTAKCMSVKMCNSIAFADVSMTSHFIGDFVFWVIHRSNHDTMSTTTLLLFAVDNWFHSDIAWFLFEISGNLSFCLLRSLTSFDGKVTTPVSYTHLTLPTKRIV